MRATLMTRVSQALRTMEALGDECVFCDAVVRQESPAPGGVARVLQGRMSARVGQHLEDCEKAGIPERRNGSYPRRMLLGVGEVALRVPRTRRYSPAAVLQRYARRAPESDRLILACFIMNASGIASARRAARKFADAWQTIYPKAVACLTGDLDELLAHLPVFDHPRWRKAARTPNAIERRFVQVRRRTRPMGVMADQTSAERIL